MMTAKSLDDRVVVRTAVEERCDVMNHLARLTTALTDALAAGHTVLFLSDFDGTLSRIVDHPDDARLAPEVREDLRTLAGAPRIRVGIISGRSLADIRARVGLEGVIYAGCHGLEIEGAGIAFTHPAAAARRADLSEIAERLEGGIGLTPGVLVERKGLCVAVHYRHVAEADLERVAAGVEAVLAPWPHLSVLHGKTVVDIVPAVEWDKGQCATHIRDHLGSGALAGVTTVYLGDDVTDERACAALGASALTVRVGGDGRSTAARFRLAGVAQVHRLVAALADDVMSRRQPCG